MFKRVGAVALSAGLLFTAGSSGVAAAPPEWAGPPDWAGQPGGPGNGNGNGNGDQKVENIIYMIPDGFNADYATNYRMYKGEEAVWDEHMKGMFTTYSADSSITDSAAAGTAMATGNKTNNGVIGLDPEGNELETILEASQDEGMASGLVATSTITHATPASFASHVEDRNNETAIAPQLLANEVDVLLGGGKNNFLPESEGGNQESDNLIEQAEDQNYEFVETRDALLDSEIDIEDGEKLLGLFAGDALAPEMHRAETEEPSLAEMTESAIGSLEEDEDGFFLMVEGSQIDWAGHANDAAWAMQDTAAFEAAVEEAIAFAEEDGETLVVVGGDHETGGMTVGTGENPDMSTNPSVLKNVTATGDHMASELNEDRSNINEVIETYTDFELSESEVQAIQEADNAAMAINTVISDRALIGWTSTNHTGVDIPVYAYGPEADEFSGYLDNTDLPKIMADALGVELGE
ncbi:alkaline phosphatase [Virgibacillus sp. NKC19-16]|uniref:alkaline phosphatase n=1 Tax=Virgibacillus salidurans TaxID=2831673 RepID=UPI001F3D78DA|nr:alkaline phosphatase [Virgibacillus sp. NKC19-16]UJL45840.1 alkaline phosphatase [Virgibacillus sp. NKC19-16]